MAIVTSTLSGNRIRKLINIEIAFLMLYPGRRALLRPLQPTRLPANRFNKTPHDLEWFNMPPNFLCLVLCYSSQMNTVRPDLGCQRRLRTFFSVRGDWKPDWLPTKAAEPLDEDRRRGTRGAIAAVEVLDMMDIASQHGRSPDSTSAYRASFGQSASNERIPTCNRAQLQDNVWHTSYRWTSCSQPQS